MFENLKRKIELLTKKQVEKERPKETVAFTSNLTENLILLSKQFPDSMDLQIREITIGKGRIAVLCCEGLTSSQTLAMALVNPLTNYANANEMTSDEIFDFIRNKSVLAAEQHEIYNFDELFTRIMYGFAIVLIDGKSSGFAIGVQGFQFRSVSEPTNEINELGSKEAFTEPIRTNLSMIRRRIRSPELRFNLMNIGKTSKTDVCVVYLNDRAAVKLVNKVKRKLSQIDIDIVLDSSYLIPFLENNAFSLFSSVGSTERPDVLCGKIREGRIAVLIDGSPYALIVPYLFSENFKSFDDYAHKPYFTTFIRVLKYFSFFISFLLPGGYVAITTFHPELLPRELLFSIASAESAIPFSVMVEAIIIYLAFEIMREAGIRLPNAVGHTIGIVGALVIGDAAVNAGLVSAPIVMVVAITAICAFTVPKLYEPIMVLRFAFIIIGGLSGLFGIALSLAFVGAIISSMNSLNIPMTAPLSPFDIRWISDSLLFTGKSKITSNKMEIQDINGSQLKNSGEGHDA